MVIILQNIPRDSPCCTRRHILHKVLSPLGDSYRCSYCCFCKYLPVLPMGIALPKIYATLWLYKHSKFKNEKQSLFYLSKNQQVTLESECPEPAVPRRGNYSNPLSVQSKPGWRYRGRGNNFGLLQLSAPCFQGDRGKSWINLLLSPQILHYLWRGGWTPGLKQGNVPL